MLLDGIMSADFERLQFAQAERVDILAELRSHRTFPGNRTTLNRPTQRPKLVRQSVGGAKCGNEDTMLCV